MMEHERADAGLGIHHHSLCQFYADLLRPQERPQALLIVKVGTRGISEAVALASVPRCEPVAHGHRRRIREAPVLANAPVEPFGARLRGFDGERLYAVRFEELTATLPLLALFANSGAGGDDEQRETVAPAILGIEDVVAQAQAILASLAGELESVNR